MRQLVFTSFGFAALLLASCGSNNGGGNANENSAAPQDRYVVRAGPVADARLNALSGTFQLIKSGAPDAIESNRIGGACLIFPAADLGFTDMASKQCNTNYECSSKESAFGYCDGQTHQCWAKPKGAANDAVCNKKILLNPSELTPVPKQPVDASGFVHAGAHVRVDACINKLGADPTKTGCATADGKDRIEVMGPIATIH